MTQDVKKFFAVEQAYLAAMTLQMHFVIYFELHTTLSSLFYSEGGGKFELVVHHDFKNFKKYVENLPESFVYSSMRSKDLKNDDGEWRATTFEFDF